MLADVILIRHGQSEGNLANKLSRTGNDSAFTEEFLARSSSTWRLTPKGVEQAQAAGAWIRRELGAAFDACLTSEHHRCLQTAAHLELPGVRFAIEPLLRERNWGELEVMTHPERLNRLKEQSRHLEEALYWTPPGGESLITVGLRLAEVLRELGRRHPGGRALLVCHGEVMWAMRVRMAHLSQRAYRELSMSADPREWVHNGQVMHYTRRDPTSGAVGAEFGWLRSICTSDETRSSSAWQPLSRAEHDAAALLALAE